MVRPLKAAIESSTKPDSFSVSVWIITCTSNLSPTERQQSIAAGVVPQSSCSFSAQAPPRICSSSAAGSDALPLPAKARLTGNASAAWIMRPRCHSPGVQVVALVPVAGPVPPPSMVVTPDISASSICCGEMKWMWLSKPPAVRIFPSPAIASVPGPMMMVYVGLDVRVAGLADGGDAAVLDADVGLHDAPVIEDHYVGDDGIDGAGRARHLRLAHAVADGLAAAELHLLAIGGEIFLDLDQEIAVGKPHLVARGGAEHAGIGGAGHFHRGPQGFKAAVTSAAVRRTHFRRKTRS